MLISYDEALSCFHLTNGSISLVVSVLTDDVGQKELMLPYFGAALNTGVGVEALYPPFPGSSFDPLRHQMPYCVPTEGRGDYRPCLVAA